MKFNLILTIILQCIKHFKLYSFQLLEDDIPNASKVDPIRILDHSNPIFDLKNRSTKVLYIAVQILCLIYSTMHFL